MLPFPREHRLTRPNEFRRVFQRGRHRHIRADGLFCKVRENECAHARLGLAISKRSLKLAVARNRVKRLVRESFRTEFPQLPNVDIVVMSETKLASMNNAAILHQLGMLWERLRHHYDVADSLTRHTLPNHNPD